MCAFRNNFAYVVIYYSMDISVTFLLLLSSSKVNISSVLFRFTNVFVKCFPCNNKILLCRVPPPNCTSLDFVIKPFVRNYVLSSFVSIATHLYFDFPYKLVHLVIFVF